MPSLLFNIELLAICFHFRSHCENLLTKFTDIDSLSLSHNTKLLFGPQDWNPPPGAPQYCHQSTPHMQATCGNYHYDKGLVGLAHANNVEVYASIGGKEGWSDKFVEMASEQESRLMVRDDEFLKFI